MTLQERIDHYVKETKYPRSLFISDDRWIVGTFIMGQNYTVKSGLYGGYPAGYLRRIKALFPDKKAILHLFSGRVDTTIMPGKTVDIDPSNAPDFIDDAQTLESVPIEEFDLAVADPPYSVEDANHYQITMVKRNLVMRALGARMQPGSHVVWLDQVLPMYRKDQWSIIGVVGVVRSTNHRFRIISIFEKLPRHPFIDCIHQGATRFNQELGACNPSTAFKFDFVIACGAVEFADTFFQQDTESIIQQRSQRTA